MPVRLSPVARRGFTLVELAVALALALVVSGVAHQVLLLAQRVAGAQVERTAAQDNVRAGTLILANELRGLGFDSLPALAGLGGPAAASSDLLLAQPTRIRYRATRGLGISCVAPAVDRLVLGADTWAGLRLPVAGVDSVAFHVEGDAATREDDAWVRAHVVGVANGTCPDGTPAMVLAIAWPESGLGAAAAARAVTGAPARILEVMEIAAYVSDGATWLGQRSLSRGEVIQPMVGPLADTGTAAPGFRLEYLDRRGTPAVEPGEVGSIVATLRGITSRPVWNARVDRPVVDTIALVSRIALRNTVRP